MRLYEIRQGKLLLNFEWLDGGKNRRCKSARPCCLRILITIIFFLAFNKLIPSSLEDPGVGASSGHPSENLFNRRTKMPYSTQKFVYKAAKRAI